MIMNTDLINKIKEYFNLNIYETKVWLALLTKGVASAGEVADLSGVPRSRTYDVLESLEKRGFAILKIGKPAKYIAVRPTEVIEKIKNKTMQEAQDKVKSLSLLKETQEYIDLEQLHNSKISPLKSDELIISLRGRPSILSQIRELIETSTEEVTICTSVSDFENKSRVILPALDRLAKSKAKAKIILSGDTDKIKKLSNKLNMKFKHSELNARFFISDKRKALFMISAENADEEKGIWLNSPFFTESLTKIIESSLSAK